MNELKRSGVIDGKVRPVTNAQHRGLLQLVIEQSHDAALAVFVERGCCFVEKDPSRLVQQKARKREALLLAERKLLVPALHQIELGDQAAEIAALERLANIRFGKGVAEQRRSPFFGVADN
nr:MULTISPECIES: hypothetical protein [unclassified Bradyrhizobium]